MNNKLNFFLIFVLIISLLLLIAYYYLQQIENFNNNVNFNIYNNDKIYEKISTHNKVHKKINDIIKKKINNHNELKQLSKEKKKLLNKFNSLNENNNILLKNMLVNLNNKYNEKKNDMYKILNTKEKCPIYNYTELNKYIDSDSNLDVQITQYINNILKITQSITLVNNLGKKITLYKNDIQDNLDITTYYIQINQDYLNYDEAPNCDQYLILTKESIKKLFYIKKLNANHNFIKAYDDKTFALGIVDDKYIENEKIQNIENISYQHNDLKTDNTFKYYRLKQENCMDFSQLFSII